MAWNEPGPGRDPWNPPPGGKRGGGPGAPDLEAVLKRLMAWLRGSGSGGGGGQLPRGAGSSIGVGLIVVWLLSGLYTVDEQERAVVLRFGAYAGTSGPGMRWHLPWPIERVEKINFTGVRSVNDRATLLTSDQNLVEVELTVQYRVASVEDYLFGAAHQDDTLQEALKAAVRQVIGHNTMDAVLTDAREAIARETREQLQTLLDQYKTGLVVSEVNLQQAQPPDAVQAAFASAIKAREEALRHKSEAEAYADDRLPRARGDAAREVAEATAYRDQVIAQAQGDAARFELLLGQYRKAPDVTRERLYMDAMSEVLAHTRKVVVDAGKGAPAVNVQLPPATPLPVSGSDASPADGAAHAATSTDGSHAKGAH